MKYRAKDSETGKVLDNTIEDTWHRVSNALAVCEEDPQRWSKEFYSILEDFSFLPGGRILAGAGTDLKVTLFNCYVMGTIPDSLEGIFDSLKEAALTMKQGGGIGYDFSTIRPAGTLVQGVGAEASGPLSFMDVWDTMCRTIMSAGVRRGAMMATMRCDHPDIEAFIEVKKDPARLRMFNLSVLCTDQFMEAVKKDREWDLTFDGAVHRTISARGLWDKIMRCTYDGAEPGVIFIDRINKRNNLAYCEDIYATNPCAEQPLPPYGACLLGSINLPRFVVDPFTPDARLDEDRLIRTVKVAVRMLDNVVDASGFPLEQQRQEARNKRRIGLGVTGLADMLAMCGEVYGSEEAVFLTSRIMKEIAISSYEASVELSMEKGPFPLFSAYGFLGEEEDPDTFSASLPEVLKQKIETYGMRNSHLLSVAPTGTISLFAGNVSGGIEPIFATEYTRKVMQKDGSKKEELVTDYAVSVWRDLHPGEPLPDCFVSAQDLPPEAHLKMQATCQTWVDSSISKTINLPREISMEDFERVYMDAYDMGCKGCTTYRPNEITGSVLSVETDHPPERGVDASPALLDRPEIVEGKTYKLNFPGEPHAFYLTVNDTELNGRVQPFEVFLNSKNVQHYAWSAALMRMVSAVFRRGGEVSFVAKELKSVFDPKGGGWVEGKYQPSILAMIGSTLEQHMIRSGYLDGDISVPTAVPATRPGKAPELCRECHSSNIRNEGGCSSCGDCGYSSCQ